jgi:hypothetical protein
MILFNEQSADKEMNALSHSLNRINELHTYGSVRNLRDRRNDLYELRIKK